MTASDGPWHTREEAAARYAAFTAAADRGASGPPGEQLVYAPGQLEGETITDTLDVLGVELGDYDREVIARLAALLGPLDSLVVNSLIQRAARDDYDQPIRKLGKDT
jgi:hypothetical protein